jgi:8-oxo-dGTP pyrophosphatase MutT (NUDIX family)
MIHKKYYRTAVVDDNTKYRKRAGVILLTANKEHVLLVKCKTYNEEDARWGFPKGSLEEGETMNECAMRELYEETGIPLKIEEELMSNTITYNIDNDIYYYSYVMSNKFMKKCIKIFENFKNEKEISRIGFVPIKKIFGLQLNYDTKRIMKNYEDVINIAKTI